jgi:hypothetical protein
MVLAFVVVKREQEEKCRRSVPPASLGQAIIRVCCRSLCGGFDRMAFMIFVSILRIASREVNLPYSIPRTHKHSLDSSDILDFDDSSQ